MNKATVATRVDHILKDAGLNKSAIKGMGWKGNGHRYRSSGYLIGTRNEKCVTVGFYVSNLLPISLIVKALTPQGNIHAMKIRGKKIDAIKKIKAALSGFVFEEKLDEYEMPYLVITGLSTEEKI
jgi:hypothetical protein